MDNQHPSSRLSIVINPGAYVLPVICTTLWLLAHCFLPFLLRSTVMWSWCAHHYHMRHHNCQRAVHVDAHDLSFSSMACRCSCGRLVIMLGALFIFMRTFCVSSLSSAHLSVFMRLSCHHQRRVVQIHVRASFLPVNSLTRHNHHCGIVLTHLVRHQYYLCILPPHVVVLLPRIGLSTRIHHYLRDTTSRLLWHYHHHRVPSSPFSQIDGNLL